MSVRVNLLKPEEIRQQSTVSRGSMIRAGGMVCGAALAAALILGVFQYRSVINGSKLANGQFAAIEAEYLDVKVMQDESVLNRQLVGELDGWSQSRIDWSESLQAVQELVPANMQLTRLSITGDIRISLAEPATEETPGTPARNFLLRIEGRARGDLSDQDVIRFVDRMRVEERFRPWLSSVKLQGLQRAATVQDDDTEAERTFRLDAVSNERLMK